MSSVHTFEATIGKPDVEDGGRALIAETENMVPDDGEFFMRLQSWVESPRHPAGGHRLVRSLVGKRVRITIEVLP